MDWESKFRIAHIYQEYVRQMGESRAHPAAIKKETGVYMSYVEYMHQDLQSGKIYEKVEAIMNEYDVDLDIALRHIFELIVDEVPKIPPIYKPLRPK